MRSPEAAAARVSSPAEPTTEPYPSPRPSPPPLERTGRALLTGCGIGVLLAAGNVYTGLKISMIDGGSITAALLGFTLFATFKRLGRTPYTALENNITQTTASSAAMASFFVGIAGPIPALELMGWRFPGWAIALWGAAIALVGIYVATLLRRKLIVEEALPFPTGSATAEVIEAIYAARATAVRRTRLLIGAALAAMAVTWLRDGRPAIIPQTTIFGSTLAGVATASLGLGISWSPLLFSTGAMIGLRAALSMVLGGGLSWVVLAPWLTRHGIVHQASFGGWNLWLVWPSLGLLVAGSFLPLLLDRGAVLRSFRDLGSFLRRASGQPGGAAAAPVEPNSPTAAPIRPRAFTAAMVAVTILIVVVGRSVFGLHPLVTLLTLGLALVLANVSARATGETDVGPVGAVGTLTLVSFASRGTVASMSAGWIAMGTSTQTSQMLWAFKAGHRLGASPRAQVMAQILGALVGAAVVVPVYVVIVKAYGIGTETMPAVAALSWRATAEAMRGGFASLPPYALQGGAAGLALGVVLILLGRTKLGAYVPIPAAMGVAMMISASMSVSVLAGALLMVVARRLRPGLDDASVMAFSAGGIAGESVMGVAIAILIATGLL